MTIRGSVGKGGNNDPADVQEVERLLANHRQWLIPMQALIPDGVCNEVTIEAIRTFQARAGALEATRVDGLVSPGRFTISRLETWPIPKPKHAVFNSAPFDRSQDALSDADFVAAAKSIDCEKEVIQAIAMQETADRGAWQERGLPTILFERHKFADATGGKWNRTHPDISNSSAGGYGKYSAQYGKLYRAATLDESAALNSASWGLFQIMGFNYKACGYTSIESFVDDMLVGQKKHLDAAVSFINANSTLKTAMKNRSWAVIARNYNGPSYAENNYDTKLMGHYNKLKAAAPAGPKK